MLRFHTTAAVVALTRQVRRSADNLRREEMVWTRSLRSRLECSCRRVPRGSARRAGQENLETATATRRGSSCVTPQSFNRSITEVEIFLGNSASIPKASVLDTSWLPDLILLIPLHLANKSRPPPLVTRVKWTAIATVDTMTILDAIAISPLKNRNRLMDIQRPIPIILPRIVESRIGIDPSLIFDVNKN